MLTGKRILIVEDEPILAMCLEDMVTDLGCLVAGVAGRVRDALALAEDAAPDAAILDVNLGDESSFAVADFLVARSIPFFFATGYGRADYLGGNPPVLKKPYAAQEVASLLHQILADPRPGQ